MRRCYHLFQSLRDLCGAPGRDGVVYQFMSLRREADTALQTSSAHSQTSARFALENSSNCGSLRAVNG